MAAKIPRALVPIDDLKGYRVARGEPDPRGWEVIASDGRKIGEVETLIVDTQARKVRYLECEVDEKALDLARKERRILIPVGPARVNKDAKQVLLDTISSDDVREMPAFTGDFTPEFEERVRAHERESREKAGRSEGAPGPEEGAQAEGAQAEGAQAERPAREPRAGEERAGKEEAGEEIRIPVKEERVVVERRPEVREEVVLKRRPAEEAEEAQGEGQRERSDTERHD